MHDPEALLADAPRVRDALAEAGWASGALEDLLGPGYHAHLDRGEGAPLLRRTEGSSPLARLARALVVGGPVDDGLLPDSWIGPDGRSAIRLQPVSQGGVEVTVPHDPGHASATIAQDQVLGAGAASLTLAAATPRDLVQSAVDIGSGAGVQALLLQDHANRVVATDTNPRAVAYARLAAVLNSVDLDVRRGDLLEPVADEAFDLVVSNPPFVISPSRRYDYRDSGYDGDEVCRRLIQDVPSVLAPGGHAVLLANWLHLAGEDGDERIRSWFEGTGCDAWVVQRELADPEEYVTAWLRDTDDTAFDARYDEWVDALKDVDAVAFGIVAMHRRTDGLAPAVSLDHVDQPVAPTWGEEVVRHFRRRTLLEGDLLDTRLTLRPDVRLSQVARATAEGWFTTSQRIHQDTGLRWSGAIDDHGASLLAACDGSARLGDLIAVLAAALDEPPGELAEQIVPVVRRLVTQGFLTG